MNDEGGGGIEKEEPVHEAGQTEEPGQGMKLEQLRIIIIYMVMLK